MLTDGSTVFYECHNPPCSNIERIVRQFNMCGRCRLVRLVNSELVSSYLYLKNVTKMFLYFKIDYNCLLLKTEIVSLV